MNGLKDARKVRWMEVLDVFVKDKWMDGWMDVYVGELMNGSKDGWMN